MIRIPIGGSDSHFFTVEVRRKTGYDEQLPGEAVVVHEVNTSWTSPAHVVDIDNDGDTGDGGAMWTAGEAFYDPIDDIRVSIINVTPTAFELTVAANKSDFVFRAWCPAPTRGAATSASLDIIAPRRFTITRLHRGNYG
jgi:hypothetical protein